MPPHTYVINQTIHVCINYTNQNVVLSQGAATVQPDKENQGNFKRKLSKREKKEKKKQEKEGKRNAETTAEKLYQDMPDSKFTRSISNPDAVMKRRREQKVQKKLQQCRGQAGQGTDINS